MAKTIRQQIDEYYEALEQRIDFSSFTFQQNNFEIYRKIDELQKQCKHHFINGKCEYCDMEESK